MRCGGSVSSVRCAGPLGGTTRGPHAGTRRRMLLKIKILGVDDARSSLLLVEPAAVVALPRRAGRRAARRGRPPEPGSTRPLSTGSRPADPEPEGGRPANASSSARDSTGPAAVERERTVCPAGPAQERRTTRGRGSGRRNGRTALRAEMGRARLRHGGIGRSGSNRPDGRTSSRADRFRRGARERSNSTVTIG